VSNLYNHILYQDFGNPTLILRDNCSISIKKIQKSRVDSFYNFYLDNLKKIIEKISNEPFLILTGCGTIPQLESLIYSKDIIDYLNSKGLTIFLFEDLYINEGKAIRFYLNGPAIDQFDKDHFDCFSKFTNGFENKDFDNLYSCELESIDFFRKQNNLKNITVYTGGFNSSQIFKERYNAITIKEKNVFLYSVIKKLNLKTTPNTINDVEKKFICPNYRYQGFRHLIVSYLKNYDSIISLNFEDQIYKTIKNHLWFDLDDWKNDYPSLYKKCIKGIDSINTDIVIDKDSSFHLNYDAEYNFCYNKNNKKAFCFVINESRFAYPLGILSEKILIPIVNKRPFILSAPPYSLKYLKSLGFKTFDKYWDESYDQEENHEKRLVKILELIDYIDSFSINELQDLYKEIINICEFNSSHLSKLKNKI